jgi:hypothetical protein
MVGSGRQAVWTVPLTAGGEAEEERWVLRLPEIVVAA